MEKSLQQLAWWQKGIIYQVYLKSFKDTNGDGIGDLRGVLDKIDYFKLIGVDIIYLSPFYPNGGTDNGYDVISYCDIDPTYGTMADFDELIKRLHDNGMYLIIDFIPNHTSNLHEWFKKSCENNSPDNPYRDYYVWYPSNDPVNPPNNWLPVVGDSAWTYNKNRKAWYYHSFLPEQPDLNFRCAAVKEEIKKVFEFWLYQKNIDGVRIDAMKHLFVDELFRDEPLRENVKFDHEQANPRFECFDHIYIFNRPENYEILVEWRQYIDSLNQKTNSTKLLFIESYEAPVTLQKYFYYENRPAAHFPLNFQLINLCETTRICLANIRIFKKFEPSSIKFLVDEWTFIRETPYFWPNWQLGNQDCSRIATRIGRENAKLANALCLLLGGTPFTYYGEEIGMEDLDYDSISFEECQDNFGKSFGPKNYKKYNRDYCRSPMQWDNTDYSGFSNVDNVKPWLPVNPNHTFLNVKSQLRNSKSTLRVYSDLTRIRKNPSFIHGDMRYAIVDDYVFSFIKHADDNPSFFVVLNLSDRDVAKDFLSTGLLPSKMKTIYYFDNDENQSYEPNEEIFTKSVFLPAKSCLIGSWHD